MFRNIASTRPRLIGACVALALCATGACTGVRAASQAAPAAMLRIPGGSFAMGADYAMAMPDEHPVHTVAVHSFWMDRTEATVARFRAFAAATHYRTDAEKFGWSGVFGTADARREHVAGRSHATPDTSLSNTGFRTVKND